MTSTNDYRSMKHIQALQKDIEKCRASQRKYALAMHSCIDFVTAEADAKKANDELQMIKMTYLKLKSSSLKDISVRAETLRDAAVELDDAILHKKQADNIVEHARFKMMGLLNGHLYCEFSADFDNCEDRINKSLRAIEVLQDRIAR